MPGLPATGTLHYNGYDFTGAHHITVEQAAILDETGRTTKEHRITITAYAIVTEGVSTADTLDEVMEDLRFKLMKSGGVLIFKNKGFGNDLVINRGTKRDVNNGPHPELLSWNPIGDNRAAEIVWRVTVTVGPCKGFKSRGIKSIQWGIGWSIDQYGMTTRTLTGFIETLSVLGVDSADRYRDFFAPMLLAGFNRTQNWTLAGNKARIDFSIMDTEINSPNPYPANVTMIDCRTRMSWRRDKEGFKPTITMTATIAMQAGITAAEAWAIFHTLASQRLDWAKRRGVYPFLTALDIEEDLFNRPQSFGISYTLLTGLRNVIGDSGLWRPIGTTWERWAISLAGTAFSNRGSSRLLDIAADEAIVNLCTGDKIISPNNAQLHVFVSPGELRMGQFQNTKPPEEKSWIKYDSAAIPYRDRPAVRQSPLQEQDDTEPGSHDANQSGIVPGRVLDYGTSSQSLIADTIQVGGASRYGIRLVGKATRVGHVIPRPRLEKVGTQSPVEVASVFQQRVVDTYFGIDLFEARWSIDYMIAANPGRVAIPVNYSAIG